MLKRVVVLLILIASKLAVAAGNFQALSQKLYPKNQADQAFVAKFFEIVELHKTSDPLLEGQGPSVREFSLDKIRFAFMVNESQSTVDLVFFNWNLPTFAGLSLEPELTRLYGAKVFVLKAIPKKSLASQGDKRDQLTNFSYLHGSRFFEAQMKLGNPDMEIPEQFKNWKPHPEYMDPSHPLRQTLDLKALVLLSPDKELFMRQAAASVETRRLVEEKVFKDKGGYFNVIMGMMIHETFHVKDGEDSVNGLADRRNIPEDREALVEQLKADAHLRDLFSTYAKIVFSLGDSLKSASLTKSELEQLGDLKVIISELKTKYPNAWSFIWNYEYTEGFAEYASAYSMIQGNVTSFDVQIDLHKKDGNNFAYRTGTFGGLYLAKRIKQMPFNNKEDHSSSVWELVLERMKPSVTAKISGELIAKYQGYPFNADSEIESCINYLVSTVTDH